MRLVRPVLVAAAVLGGAVTVRSTQARPIAPQTSSPCTASVPAGGTQPRALVSAANGTGYRLLQRLQAREGNGNVFLSPAGIELALAMAYNGSAGTTTGAMASTLGLGGMSRAQVRARAAALLAALSSGDARVRLDVANSLWARSGFPFRQSFINQTRRSFAAKIATLDFSAPTAPDTINAWVACATRGTISRIVNRIPRDTVMYLINTIYFNGAWSSPFLSSQTRSEPFTAAGGRSETVSMMRQSGRFPYLKGRNFQAISLPYGSGRFAMTVILPDAGISLTQLQPALAPAAWQRRQAAMTTEYGTIALPRFSIANTFTLKQPLSELGMARAFSRQADFSNLCRRPCRISEVLHKTYLRVYEKGTEAAAVTSVGVGATAVQTPQFNLVVDRPFYVAIRDGQTGSLLFLGAINNPRG